MVCRDLQVAAAALLIAAGGAPAVAQSVVADAPRGLLGPGESTPGYNARVAETAPPADEAAPAKPAKAAKAAPKPAHKAQPKRRRSKH